MNAAPLFDMVASTRNATLTDMASKGAWVMATHFHPVCAISGGSDSDDVLDIVHRLDSLGAVSYVFFDTGLEMEATKNHLSFLEDKYNIHIDKVRPKIPVPLAVKKYGQPVFSKHISEMMMRLQKHNFQWENEPFDVLIKKYPNCKSALKWWCDEKPDLKNGKKGILSISAKPHLKDFIIAHPPTFSISNKCCYYAKKTVIHKYANSVNADLCITGIRKAEGGVRAVAYSSCFSTSRDGDEWRPIFWFTKQDKIDYEQTCNVTHSECYTKYGLPRTGCAACPFGDFEAELNALKEYEPKMYKFVTALFSESFEYMRQYKKYLKET